MMDVATAPAAVCGPWGGRPFGCFVPVLAGPLFPDGLHALANLQAVTELP